MRASCKPLVHDARFWLTGGNEAEVEVELDVPHPVRVLVVEDDLANRVLLGRLLERAGHTVTTAADGGAALDLATPDAVDVLLLDLGLPDMDGLEVCRRLRRNPRTATLPVILVSGRDGAHEAALGVAAGADGCIGKPYDVTALLAMIERVVRREPPTDVAS